MEPSSILLIVIVAVILLALAFAGYQSLSRHLLERRVRRQIENLPPGEPEVVHPDYYAIARKEAEDRYHQGRLSD